MAWKNGDCYEGEWQDGKEMVILRLFWKNSTDNNEEHCPDEEDNHKKTYIEDWERYKHKKVKIGAPFLGETIPMDFRQRMDLPE